MLLDIAAIVRGAAGRIAGNDAELCEWAAKKARDCGQVAARLDDQDSAFLVLSEIATRSGISAPDMSKGMTMAGAVKHLCCERWWRRQARKSQGRGVEAAAIQLHMVHRHADLYASDESVERRAGQKRRNRLMLESCLAVNELGDEFTLAELSDLSVSNPAIRRGELMTRMAGFETATKRAGQVGEGLYPRARGGNPILSAPAFACGGLSPRTRGKRQRVAPHPASRVGKSVGQIAEGL